MKKKREKTVRLNQLDFQFFALENVVTAFTQVVTVRFKEKHTPSEIKSAIRYMLTIYPRLRSVVEPTLLSYRICVIDENDTRLETLFDDSFKVKRNLKHDSEAYVDYRRGLFNESFSLEHGLPIKIRYIPDDPRPVLLLSIHHIACDGMGWIHLVNSLVSHLNGNHPPVVLLENSSLKPALFEKSFYKIPLQIYQSYKILRNDIRQQKGYKIIRASTTSAKYFSPSNIYQQHLKVDFSSVIAKSKKLNCSITVLLLTALSMAFMKRRSGDGGNVVGTILSLDSRPYFREHKPIFGNYALTSMIWARKYDQGEPAKIIDAIDKQVKRSLLRLKNKEIIVSMLVEKLYTMVGKKYYAWGAKAAKKRGLIPMTCAVSNLGNLNGMNSYGGKAQVCEAIATVPHPNGLFITMSGMDGRLNLNFSYPEAEFERKEIIELKQFFEIELGELLKI